MAVFNGHTRTPTRGSLDHDAWRPRMGALDSPACCQEQTLIHGNQQLKIEGNRQEEIARDHTARTGGNFSCLVVGWRQLYDRGNFLHVTAGGEVRNVLGATRVSRMGVVNATYAAQVVEHHAQMRQIFEPVPVITCTARELNSTLLSVHIGLWSGELCAAHLSAYGVSAELKALAGEWKWLSNEKKPVVIKLFQTAFRISITNISFAPIFLKYGATVGSPACLAPNSICM